MQACRQPSAWLPVNRIYEDNNPDLEEKENEGDVNGVMEKLDAGQSPALARPAAPLAATCV